MSKNWQHDPIWFAPTAKMGGGWIAHKDSPSPPAAPDYTGAAQATASGNIEAAREATKANRVNTYTPYGSQTYSQTDPNDPASSWVSNISLAPDAQRALDSQMRFSTQMGDLGQQQLGQVQNQGAPDLSSVQNVQDKAYQAYTSRLDPQWDQREKALDAQLRNQGLVAGGEAYTNAMRDFNTGRNDAYQQANLGAIQTAPQTYQMAQDIYNQPLNRFNAFRSGTQVQNPTFSQAPQQQQTPGVNYSGAATQQGAWDQGLYNAGVGSANSFNSGLMGIGAAGLMRYSDRRLKSNINRIGTHPLGIGIYEYDIFGKHDIGVMADEVEAVLPSAVTTHSSGYKMVDYGKL